MMSGCSTVSSPQANWGGIFYGDNSLWSDMRYNMALDDHLSRHQVKKQLARYEREPQYIYHTFEKSAPYLYYIFNQTRLRGLPAELALVPFIESNYNPFDYSRAGAVGLWQMMPGTASGFKLKINWWFDGRRDIVASTNAALNYLAYLHSFFNNNWLLALAAYDSGEGTVQRAIQYNRAHHLSTRFWSLPLPKETKAYVPKLLAIAAVIQNPDYYHIKLPPISDMQYLTLVDVGIQIDLRHAAQLAGLSIDELLALNPGFRRWATDPDGPYTLLLPSSKVALFKEKLRNLPAGSLITWRHHIIQHGDTLDHIATQYKTKVAILKKVNHLRGNMIHSGQSLLIPEAYHGPIHNPVLRQHAVIAETRIPGPQQHMYHVQHGDSLGLIAAKYGVNTKEIRFWNNLGPHQPLHADQTLTVWVPEHFHFPSFYHYRVKSGDVLGSIADQFNTTVKDIRITNGLKNNLIHAGKVLYIPLHKKAEEIPVRSLPQKHSHAVVKNHWISYQVKSGDSVDKIAMKFEASREEVLRWNRLPKDHVLHIGDHLAIYIRK